MKTRLKEIRRSRGITQVEMASLLGINQRRYASWERMEREPNAVEIVKCAHILGCSTDEILGVEHKAFDDPMEKELHKVWTELPNHSRATLLDMAKGQLALNRLRGVDDDA